MACAPTRATLRTPIFRVSAEAHAILAGVSQFAQNPKLLRPLLVSRLPLLRNDIVGLAHNPSGLKCRLQLQFSQDRDAHSLHCLFPRRSAAGKTTNKNRRKELEALRQHYDGPIRRNGFINLAIVILSWGLYVSLWTRGIDPVLRLYALVSLLIVLNVLQELHLWVTREGQLRRTLDYLADKP